MASKRRLHETDDENDEERKNMKGKSKTKKIYHQVFKPEHASSFPTLSASKKGSQFAFCRVCNSDFSVAHGGRYDCKKHCETASHKTNEKNAGKTTLATFLQRSTPSKCVQNEITRAEALMCGLVAELNLPLSTADTLTKALPKLFPDSKIAAGIKCGRNKATAVIKEMSAMAMDSLAKRMQVMPYSIATDGSNDADKKQFPLVVTIQGVNGLVNAELLALPVCIDSATGRNIFDIIDREFSAQRIPWENCLSFGCDNANVMTGAHKGVFAFVKEKQPSVHLANCCLHLVHIAAKKAAACLPPVEDILIDVFYYFQKSVNRQTELKNLQALYDTEQRKVLKHVCTRWLSIARCLERLLLNWQPLQHFFSEEKKNSKKKEGQSSHASSKVETVYGFLKSPTNHLFCHFLSYTVKVYNPVLLQLQAEEPMIFMLHKSLCNLIYDLFGRFLLPTAFCSPDGTRIDVDKVDYKSRTSQKEDCDLLIGTEAKKMIQHAEKHHLRRERIKEFFASVRTYFTTAIGYLLEKMPLQNQLLQAAEVVDYRRQQDTSLSQLEYFLERFPSLVPASSSIDAVMEQFISYQTSDITACYEEGDRADKVWKQIAEKHTGLKDLSVVMRAILTIPHSSAACERIFSMVRKTCTEGRSSMLQDTTEALLVLKGQPGSCLDANRELSEDNLKAIKSAYYNALNAV